MSYSDSVNTTYGNTGDSLNPVFRDIIVLLEEAKLYMSALGDRTSLNPAAPYIELYNNPTSKDNKGVALDVISDAISRAILKGYRDGFAQANVSKDGASNISFSALASDKFTTLGTDISNSTDVHQAIIMLCAEITALKTLLASIVGNSALGTTPLATNVPNVISKLNLN